MNPPVPPGLTSGIELRVSTAGGSTLRRFDAYVPTRGLRAGAPLVIVFHGGTRSSRDVVLGGEPLGVFRELAETEGLLLLAPNGTDAEGRPDAQSASWNDCRPETTSRADDVAFFDALVDWARVGFDIDERRIYVTGPSNGGLMSYRLVLERAPRIAAAVAFIANLPEPSIADCFPGVGAVPIAIMNGTTDRLMAYEGGTLTAGDGGTVLSTLDTVTFWRERNGARLAADVFAYPDEDRTDGSTISRMDYLGDDGKPWVRFFRVEGGGHAIPSRAHPLRPGVASVLGGQNRDVEGAVLAWEFMRLHRR